MSVIMGGSQNTGINNLLFKEPRDASKSIVLVLMEELSLCVFVGSTTHLVGTGPGDS